MLYPPELRGHIGKLTTYKVGARHAMFMCAACRKITLAFAWANWLVPRL
jgi:hypothetical protein